MNNTEKIAMKSSGYPKYFSTIKFMMILSGLWTSPSQRYLNIKRFVFFNSLLSTGIYGLFNSLIDSLHDIFSTVECLLYLSLFSIAQHAYIHMARNSKLINKMFTDVETSFNGFFDKVSLKDTELQSKTDINNRFFIRMVAGSIAAAHLSRFTTTEAHQPNSSGKKPFIPFSLPFYKSDSLYYYYPMYVLQLSVSSTAGLMNVLSIAVCVGFINFLSCELDVLKYSFENAVRAQKSEIHEEKSKQDDQEEKPVKNSSKQKEKEIYFPNLGQLVEQHKNLIRSAESVQIVISPIAFNMFITSEFMLCFTSFQLFQMYVTSTEVDFRTMVANISMLIGLICQEFVYFVFGQRLESKSSDLHKYVYYSLWYNASSKYNSSLRIILERTKRPLVLMAGSLIPINLKSFVRCLQASFSYFNLLRALSST